jgi:drug/metabolite transporter (DMT)-like permease
MIWGSSFILMKRSLDFFSNTELGALRISFAGLVLLPFAYSRLKKVQLDQWKWLILVGVIGNTFPAFLFAKAQTVIDSSLAGILNSTTPMFALLVGLVVYKLKAHWVNYVGILFGLIGAIMIILAKNEGHIDFSLQYSAYVVLATVFYAFNLNIVKYNLKDTDPYTIAIISFSLVFVPVFTYLLAGTNFLQSMQNPAAVHALIYPAILGIFGSAIAIVIFNNLVKIAGVLFSASVTYLIPVVASIIGFADGEKFKPIYVFWIALILFGVFLVNKKPKPLV